MILHQFVDEGLGNSAYLVGSRETGSAALIDPLRDVDRYLAEAERLSLRITHVLDTHLHADFVSGARETAAQTGALIGASAGAGLGFDHRPLREGDTLEVGAMMVGVLSTPGHTPEHISFTLTEPGAKSPDALFSGGALIVGGAARTDLISHDLTVPLARQLYHTIHDKLMRLPDSVRLYPTHGAGSYCAAPTSSERSSTIGHEKQWNYLAVPQSEEEFLQAALDGLPTYPVYYRELRQVNRLGPRVLGGVPELRPMAPEEVHQWIQGGGAVLDVRHPYGFAEAHIPGSYGIAADTPLITWAGWQIPFGTPLVLVSRDASERELAVRQLIRIGYDDLRGYLEGGLEAWAAAGYPLSSFPSIRVGELRERMGSSDAPLVLDVRQDSEWQAGHIPGAMHIENGRLPWEELPLPHDRPIAVHCQHGARSTAGLSVLERLGYGDLTLVRGGFSAWERAGYEVERENN